MIHASHAYKLSKSKLVAEERVELEEMLKSWEDSKNKVRSHFPHLLSGAEAQVFKATRNGFGTAVLDHIPIGPCKGNLLSGIPEPYDELVLKFKSLGYHVSLIAAENEDSTCSMKFLVLNW